MIKHIVAWNFADEAEGADKATNVALVADALRALPAVIDGIVEFEVVVAQPGMDMTFDLALNSAFTDAEALQAYAVHPEHQKVVALIGARRTGRACIDYDPEKL
ncbi:Dabb family protein [Micropruina sonneratiae]|uniref:Dabb family protein n=1 Tax=Micropruina sonneratiae TaxID=2986940 RepID=UPI002225C83D|nr:Dabb family protein [Micropruina sp. KQZ13P-5]MCW3158704.1 Dabb family protein [Micropruina sp. KQZ13P-5]